MKSVVISLSLVALLFLVNSCNKCNNDDPTARVVNNGTSAANLQITSFDGNIVSITDLEKGFISSENSYAPGTATLSGSIEGIQLTETLDMSECTAYDVTITSDNKIVVFSQNKN
jgi:hypothetical protein